ncbi:MAG: M16 family metallopeptidase, partial [Cryomorphaceae bacterium]
MFKIKSILLAAATVVSTLAFAEQEPQTDEFEVDGLKVILRHSVKGTVSARLFVLGGTSNYSKEKEGIESLALNLAVQSGPDSMTKQEFNAAAEKVGARLNANAGYDYANLSLTCVKLHWDKSWELFAKSITNPAWRQTEFDVFRDQLVTASKQSVSNPDAQLGRLSMSKAWEGTDYEKFPSGSPEALE